MAPRASVRCQATPVRASAGAFVSAAAAAILLATPAHAGVVLAENPGVKKFGDAPAAKTEEPKKAEKKQDGGEVGEGIDVRLVAFPLVTLRMWPLARPRACPPCRSVEPLPWPSLCPQSLIGAASVLLIPGVSNTVAENGGRLTGGGAKLHARVALVTRPAIPSLLLPLAAIKDSAVLGAGFEVAIKEGQVASGGARKGNGTMKVKGGAKKGLF